ncbi:unnamed protein product [Sphagnum jensenii]|uniref:Uncharacterized protein n=1 Tax=Sphagnum jensenii TaxID=128206 RepID=A0ABP0V8U0_9BRYO
MWLMSIGWFLVRYQMAHLFQVSRLDVYWNNSLPPSWLRESSGSKWIGLEPYQGGVDGQGYYNFDTSFALPGYLNQSYSSLIVPFIIAASGSVTSITLNNLQIYDCSSLNFCNITSHTNLLLTQYLQPFDSLQVTIYSSGTTALGLLVEFTPAGPQPTGVIGQQFDESWLITSAPYLIDEPYPAFKVSSIQSNWALPTPGSVAGWISSMSGGDAIFSYDPDHNAAPYIILPHDTLGPSEIVTVEAWLFNRVRHAMNYTVTLTTSAHDAPKFSDCGNAQSQCYCQSSQSNLLTYFTEVGRLTQNVTILNVNDSSYFVNYTYHSGVCFEAIVSSDFSALPGPCFPPDTTILQKGSSTTLMFILFELYPDGNAWVSSSPVSALNDYTVVNATIIITDIVSAIPAPQNFNYTSNFTIIPPALVPSPISFNYTIVAGDPLTSSPFSWLFSVRIERLDSTENDAIAGTVSPVYSIVDKTWYVPVTGIVSAEVPNFYLIASDPIMIYLVLRDPPGGGSYSTFHAGQSLTFDMSVNQKAGYSFRAMATVDTDVGADEDVEESEAPLGVGIVDTGVDIEDQDEGGPENQLQSCI